MTSSSDISGHVYLAVHDVVRRFGDVTALDKVSLNVAEGEVICLVGQSGCGKSTLLRVIAGIEQPDFGHIALDGRELSSSRSYVEPEERGIGFMFQDYALFPHLNVLDNILFGLKRHRNQDARKRSEEVIDRLGLAYLGARFPYTLSGG